MAYGVSERFIRRITITFQICRDIHNGRPAILPLVDFAQRSLILDEIEMRGEPQWLRGPIGRPLEPDAGNAVEGSEGPMPDWRFQPCDFSAQGFFVVRKTIRNSGIQKKKFLFSYSLNLTFS